MKKKILLSPLIIVILIIIFGATAVGAAVLLGGGGNSENVNLQKGLVGWWKFDGDAKDATPYSNDGTVTGTTLTTDRKGTANKAYSFNGSSDFVNVGNGASLNPTSAVTYAVWLNASALAGEMDVLTKYGTQQALSLFILGASPNRKIAFFIANSTTYDIANDTAEISTGQWYHAVGTYDGSNIKVYVNGVLKRTVAFTGAIKASAGTNVNIGRVASGSYYFNGSLDEARIYNRALSATEVTALYESY